MIIYSIINLKKIFYININKIKIDYEKLKLILKDTLSFCINNYIHIWISTFSNVTIHNLKLFYHVSILFKLIPVTIYSFMITNVFQSCYYVFLYYQYLQILYYDLYYNDYNLTFLMINTSLSICNYNCTFKRCFLIIF